VDDSNAFNIYFFENESMRGLFQMIDDWQHEHKRRLLSTSILRDGDLFCCIALSNPSEVVIVDGSGPLKATVERGRLITIERP